MHLYGALSATSFKLRCLLVANEWERFAAYVSLVCDLVRISKSHDQEAVVVTILFNLSNKSSGGWPICRSQQSPLLPPMSP